MAYLNILIGFSFIMLVFAIGVSVAQTTITRLLRLKGKAVLEHVLAELQEQWRQSDLPEKAFAGIAASLTAHLTAQRGKHARTLHACPIGDRQVTCAILRRFGKEALPHLLAGAVDGNQDLDERWERIVQSIEHRWDSIAPMISASYTGSTKRYMLGLSIVVVLLFNVDALRILRILAVDPNVRAALVADATGVVAVPPAQPPEAASPPGAGAGAGALAQVSDWHKQNVAELRSAGLPLGWQTAPLWVCEGGEPATYQQPCSGALSLFDTAVLWLVSVFGLAVGVGLVSQGAPFWFGLLQTQLGLKRGAGQPPPPRPPPEPRPPPAQPPQALA